MQLEEPEGNAPKETEGNAPKETRDKETQRQRRARVK